MKTLILMLGLACGTVQAAVVTSTWTLVDHSEILGWSYDRFVEKDGSVFALPGLSVSRDEGRTWEDKSGAVIFDAAFSTRLDAVASDAQAALIEISTDAGASWKAIEKQPESGLYAVGLFNENDGFGIGDSGAIVTRDGGRTWRKLERPAVSLAPEPRAVVVLDDKRAWAAIENFDDSKEVRILRTDDSGKTWDDIPVSGLSRALALCFTDKKHGWLLGEPAAPFSSSLLSTSDGGMTWVDTGLERARAEKLRSLACRDDKTAWAAGPGLLIGTNDGGRTWSELDGPATGQSFDVGLFYGRAKDGGYLLLGTNDLVKSGVPGGTGEDKPEDDPNGSIYRLSLKK